MSQHASLKLTFKKCITQKKQAQPFFHIHTAIFNFLNSFKLAERAFCNGSIMIFEMNSEIM